MGQGSSTSAANKAPSNNNMRRTSSAVNNNSFIESNPDPEYISTRGDDEEQNASTTKLKSKSYLNYRRSTASLGKLFRKKKWKSRKSSISASFNMHDSHMRVELLNVNNATEEQLMTLHGVNRALAQNIVNHRDLIGGFRKIEDLALVSGMGASKLSQIRNEICISRRRPGGLSLASSKAPSCESIPSTMGELNRPASNMSRILKLVNINQASIFDLMTVGSGMNQATAARIIEYRDKKGPFRCVDDLRRVGIHRRALAAIKVYLTTEEVDSDKSSTISSNTPIRPPRHIHRGKSSGLLSVNSNTIQPVAECQLEDELKVMYELLSLRTKRQHPEKLFSYYHNNCPAYRVATWNLESLTVEKIDNPGVMEVITRTILENRFSVLSVQEICDKVVLQKICKEINEPTLRLNSEWTGYRGNWRYVIHPSHIEVNDKSYQLGVLYDSLRVDSVELPKGCELQNPIQNGSLWQYGVFQIHCHDTNWVLVNVLSVPNLSNSQGAFNHGEITESVKSVVQGTDGAIIMGYFNPKQAQKGLQEMSDLEMVLPNEKEEKAENINCSIWTTSGLKQYFTDDHGLVEDGLSHLAIPNGWTWGGKVSKFGPLWCTILGSTEPKSFSDEEEELPSLEKDISDDYDVPAR